MMPDVLKIGELEVRVSRKPLKNVHIVVKPPAGSVSVSAPLHVSDHAIRAFIIRRLRWIREQQAKFSSQERESPREYLERESHYVWGRRYLLKIEEHRAAPKVEIRHNKLVLSIRPDATQEARSGAIERWYRDQVRERVPALLEPWERRLRVSVRDIYVQRMKTRWGSCNPSTSSIRLNTDLAKKPPECLEYILVHELMHLLEPTHNANFIALMDRHLPGWPQRRDQLNRLPVRHLDWIY